MTTISHAVKEIRAAAITATVPGVRLRGYKLGEDITPPAILVGPPSFTPRGYCADGLAADATFPVWVIVALDDKTAERLYTLAPAVAIAIEAESQGTVSDARPATYGAPSGDLPAYELTVTYPITITTGS